VRFLSADETRRALSMARAIESVRSAFGPDTEAPLRQAVGASLVMPGRVGDSMAVKVVSTVPGSPSGIVIVFDGSGAPVGVVDGPTITAIRTAAVAGLATDILAAGDASRMAMIGAGAMATDQVLAIREVRDIKRLVVWSRDTSKAERLAAELGGQAVLTTEEAVDGADIVTTATPSAEPLFEEPVLASAVHINAVGAYLPSMAEIPAAFVRDAFVVVDDLEAAAAEAGDLIQAGRTADMDLRALLTTVDPPRHERTLFKSVGIATQDVAAAVAALDRAEQIGLGTVV